MSNCHDRPRGFPEAVAGSYERTNGDIPAHLQNGAFLEFTGSFEEAVDCAQKEYVVTVKGRLDTLHFLAEYGLLNDETPDTAREILTHGMEVKEFYYLKADELVEKLKALPLKTTIMKKVYKKLDELKEALTELTVDDNTITVSLPAKVKEIQNKWKKEAADISKKDEKPDDSEARKREELKQAEEEKARKKAQEAAHRAEEEEKQQIKRVYDTWKEECKVVEQRRSKEFQKLLQEERSTMIETAESTKQKAIDAADEIIKSENCRLHDAEAALAGLGFFSFSQKRKLKTIISGARSRIRSAENAKTKAQADYQTEKNEIVKKLHFRQIDLKAKLEREYSLPSEPERPNNASSRAVASPNQLENERFKQDVLNYLTVTAEPATATDILKMLVDTWYPHFTNQRISKHIHDLVDEGKIAKSIDRGKAFFSLPSEPTQPDNQQRNDKSINNEWIKQEILLYLATHGPSFGTDIIKMLQFEHPNLTTEEVVSPLLMLVHEERVEESKVGGRRCFSFA